MKSRPEVVRIKEIYKNEVFKVYCLFSNNEYRFIDFEVLFKKWNIKQGDIEYPLLNISEFQKVKLVNGTLSWDNITISLLNKNKQEEDFPYDLDPIVLYQNSQLDQDKIFENLGILLKTERIKSGLTQKQLAKKSGLSVEYISQLENEKPNLELLLIRDIFRNGFGKQLKINIE
jgi:DNA-binding XRE family transcriptional regulator